MPACATATASPGAGPATTSSSAALSRTVRVRECVQPTGYENASRNGVLGTRPRDGLSPKRPHAADGMRIEPPPSFPCAIGTMPDATAAAEPPLEPPADRVRSCGLRVGPWNSGSVEPFLPSSGVLVMPSTITPASRARATARLSALATSSDHSRDPRDVGSPVTCAPSAFTRYGTPANGPSPGGPAASLRAASKRSATSAFTSGSTASMRAMAASTASTAVTSPARIAAARAVPSSSSYQPSATPHPTEWPGARRRAR